MLNVQLTDEKLNQTRESFNKLDPGTKGQVLEICKKLDTAKEHINKFAEKHRYYTDLIDLRRDVIMDRIDEIIKWLSEEPSLDFKIKDHPLSEYLLEDYNNAKNLNLADPVGTDFTKEEERSEINRDCSGKIEILLYKIKLYEAIKDDMKYEISLLTDLKSKETGEIKSNLVSILNQVRSLPEIIIGDETLEYFVRGIVLATHNVNDLLERADKYFYISDDRKFYKGLNNILNIDPAINSQAS